MTSIKGELGSPSGVKWMAKHGKRYNAAAEAAGAGPSESRDRARPGPGAGARVLGIGDDPSLASRSARDGDKPAGAHPVWSRDN